MKLSLLHCTRPDTGAEMVCYGGQETSVRNVSAIDESVALRLLHLAGVRGPRDCVVLAARITGQRVGATMRRSPCEDVIQ